MIHWSQLAFAESISIALFAAIVWVAYTYFTFRRFSLHEAGLRCMLLAVALSCLCLLIYRPQYSRSRPGSKALLLTQETEAITDSLPVFALPHVPVPATVPKVPDLAFIERNHPEIKQLYIAGYGLDPQQTKNLQRLQVNFLEKEPPAGFSWLSYSKQVREGEEMTVSGTYNNFAADTVKLLLVTSEGVQDSVLLASGVTRFVLQAPARIPGKYIASLRLSAPDSSRTELLPFVVHARQPLQVLMLQSFPSFEMNYLKEWLSMGKNRIHLRARISRDTYATQIINSEQKAGAKPVLSEESLNSADLLICDVESLRQLSAAEKKRITSAVRQGLGILVLTDEEWLKKPEILGRRFQASPSRVRSFVPRQAVQVAQGKLVADKLPATFADHLLLVPVAYSREGERIAAYLPEGKGRVGAQLAATTFPWILQGEKAMYSHFWTGILQTISRRQPAKDLHLAGMPFVLKSYPATIAVTDTLLMPATIGYASGIRQQAMPGGELPGRMETAYQFLPAEEGWINITFGEDTAQSYQVYVLPAEAWADLKKAYWWRQQARSKVDFAAANEYTYKAWEQVPPLWFFLPLITSLAVLWWREKR